MKIQEIELTDKEKDFYNKVCWHLPDLDSKTDEEVRICLDNQLYLFVSLHERGAIPKQRLDWFTNKDINSGKYGKSKFDTFANKDLEGLTNNFDFTAVLKYFIHGPNLRQDIIEEFYQIFEKDEGTTGMLISQFGAYVRKKSREGNANKYHEQCYNIGEEFVKLKLEITKNDHKHDLNRYCDNDNMREAGRCRKRNKLNNY